MPRKFIRRYLPDHKTIRDNQSIQFLGSWLHEPNLWHLNRRSASGAVAVGLFCAFLPIPFQMVAAAIGAIMFRVNLPISVVGVWITNPITIPPIFYFNYLVGETLMGMEPLPLDFELTAEWFVAEIAHIWQPLLLGSLVMATIMSALGYFVVRGLWRLHIVKHYRRRKQHAQKAGSDLSSK